MFNRIAVRFLVTLAVLATTGNLLGIALAVMLAL